MNATRKGRKTRETPEQTVVRWQAGAAKGFGYAELVAVGWEPGQVGALECDGLNYERFPLPGGDGYVVVEWDNDGNVCVI